MTNQQGVAITGMGIISAIGMNISQTEAALMAGKHGIRPIQRLDTAHKGRLLAGEVLLENQELYAQLGLDESKAYTRTELLSFWAVKEALENGNINTADAFRTGLISATTVGGMDTTERFYNDYLESDRNRHFIPNHPSGYAAEQVAREFGIREMSTTISTACSSAANAIMLGARMIKAGMLDRAVVGGVDSLSRFTVNGFNALRIYSAEHCRPFDATRDGLNLGEAAAYLVLESEKVVNHYQRSPLAYISGYGNANDSFHQTASSDHGDGAYMAMQDALKIAGLEPGDISYINAHGTATPNNDLSEGHAMLRLFENEDKLPPFSSTKAFTGHTLAAAGAIEAVFSILAIQNQAIPPNLNFTTAIPELNLIPVTAWTPATINHVLSNSLGFGGNCSSLVLSKTKRSTAL